MFKIKFSPNMALQLIESTQTFSTKDKAEYYGITTYGSGSHNKEYGWYIVGDN